MKKILSVGALALCALFVIGCGGSKKLTCTMSQDMMGISMTLDTVVEFKSDKATKIEMITVMEAEDEETAKALKESYDSDAEEEMPKGVTLSTNVKGKKFTATMKYDLTKLSAEDKEDAGFTGEKYDDLKKEIEASGFKCK